MDPLFEQICGAHAAIRPQVAVTPLARSPALSAALGCEVSLKLDFQQPTGSFKIRGATNKVRSLDDATRRRGVLTASTGNHGMAVARAGALAGVPVTVYVGNDAAPMKVDGIRALGAEVVVVDGPAGDAEATARQCAEEEGRTYISPYNDPAVMAGQGTLGIELAEQDPDLDAVFIAVGAGGLMGGAGTALHALRPGVEMVGVWPEASPCMLRALEAGAIVPTPEFPTLSDGTLGAIEPGSITFPACQKVIDTRIMVDEAEIAAAMRTIAETECWMIEGAAGVAFAGLIQQAERYRGRKVAVVLCGRNIALDLFLRTVGQPGERAV
ncbi:MULTISPECIES: threonine/serine dehydratase [unclassified Sphingopyxis]|uniref:threonine/serine dehydratase n=1 Tax=unclassified Sphingopyxis TaxID=2614943 RepID=UPI000736A687|nr:MULTISPECIES: threonine/serine dehydratase [unclassified Sphingopyxis]KTE38403.1 hypothetical protein ATE62_11345 [Sphingopyxis sp. HIX]KTE84189.1 hypothetical protein ATE72_10270 [Sphingopyxis sp. HXXIV]